jgi:hypothetical protein
MLYRAFSMFGLGAFFLAISPPLRESLVGQISAIALYLDDHGPWSYCALTMGALGAAMLWIHRASQHR